MTVFKSENKLAKYLRWPSPHCNQLIVVSLSVSSKLFSLLFLVWRYRPGFLDLLLVVRRYSSETLDLPLLLGWYRSELYVSGLDFRNGKEFLKA